MKKMAVVMSLGLLMLGGVALQGCCCFGSSSRAACAGCKDGDKCADCKAKSHACPDCKDGAPCPACAAK